MWRRNSSPMVVFYCFLSRNMLSLPSSSPVTLRRQMPIIDFNSRKSLTIPKILAHHDVYGLSHSHTKLKIFDYQNYQSGKSSCQINNSHQLSSSYTNAPSLTISKIFSLASLPNSTGNHTPGETVTPVSPLS